MNNGLIILFVSLLLFSRLIHSIPSAEMGILQLFKYHYIVDLYTIQGFPLFITRQISIGS